MDNQFPYDIDNELGVVQFFVQECPGVYFISCNPQFESSLCNEFYIVEETTPAISNEAKKMGHRLAGHPNLLAYEIEDVSGGQKIVEYEASKFRALNGLCLSNEATLHGIAIDGMETNPEYFGTYPVPSYTPWGYTLRHKAIDNGAYWIETDQCCRILAICYAMHDELSEAAQKLAVQEERDKELGLDNTMGYLFFTKEASCLPVFELMQARRHWERSGIINRRALENAIWRYYPEYATEYNIQEVTGQHDMAGQLLNSIGANVDLNKSIENMIVMSHETDVDFCTLME